MTNGLVAKGWEPVADAFNTNYKKGREVGSAVAVFRDGHPVIDIWGGFADPASKTPYTRDTVHCVASSGKGVLALAVARCVQAGWLVYEDRVVGHWPEFGEAGKEQITVSELLAHRGGLAALDPPTTFEDIRDSPMMTARLAAQTPEWEPGTAHGYHAFTYGWLVAELIRRVDPRHRNVGRFVEQEITRPLGLDLWMGSPETLRSRLSALIEPPAPTDPPSLERAAQVNAPGALGERALSLNGALRPDGSEMCFNNWDLLTGEFPAANMVTNARSLARLYASTLVPVDNERILDPSFRDLAVSPMTPDGELDLCLLQETRFSAGGFMNTGSFLPMLGEGSFGHNGAGGSYGFAHHESGISVGYVMNQMVADTSADPRSVLLVEAIRSCL
jgi:CubicO group peptidase (beta-lactamase class C family)